jgi:hypothetical protein
MHNVIQVREVPIVQAAAACELPDALDRVQLRAVGREVIEREASGVLLPPIPVQTGMMVLGVVGNDHDAALASGAGGLQVLEKLPAGEGVELIRLTPIEKLPVAQADGSVVDDALAGGRVKHHRVLGFGRDPHLTARTVLLKMHFVHGPKINRGIEA